MNTVSMKPRIEPLAPPYTSEVATMLEKLMPPGFNIEPLILFRTMAHNLELSNRLRPLYSGILAHGTVDAAEREIVILRTCARCGAEYEWGVHATSFGRVLNIPEAKLTATVTTSADETILSERETLLIRMVDELHATATLSDALWEKLALHWNEAQLIELLLIVGMYHAISYIANAARVPLEDWARRFPEDSNS